MMLESFQRIFVVVVVAFFSFFFFSIFSSQLYLLICCKYLSFLRKAVEAKEWLGVFRKLKNNTFRLLQLLHFRDRKVLTTPLLSLNWSKLEKICPKLCCLIVVNHDHRSLIFLLGLERYRCCYNTLICTKFHTVLASILQTPSWSFQIRVSWGADRGFISFTIAMAGPLFPGEDHDFSLYLRNGYCIHPEMLTKAAAGASPWLQPRVLCLLSCTAGCCPPLCPYVMGSHSLNGHNIIGIKVLSF